VDASALIIDTDPHRVQRRRAESAQFSGGGGTAGKYQP